jgi:D-glutamate N-acetyltransferase
MGTRRRRVRLRRGRSISLRLPAISRFRLAVHEWVALMLGRSRRLALLAEGRFSPLDAKTAVGVLRYRAQEVAAVLDSTRAGRTAQQCAGVGGAIPVVADLAAAAAAGADSLLIGVAPQGGELPQAWRPMVREALERGWDVLSGLHAFLADDPDLAAAASRSGARLLDVRRPPARRPVAARRARSLDAVVVLTVGSDCNVGKMTAALELRSALAEAGIRAAFVATGQTGIFVADEGVAVDALPADFVAGVTEELVMAAAERSDVVIVEGQGALHHPGYSGVTLALLHGACPELLVLCHEAGRDRVRLYPAPGSPPAPEGPAIPALPELVRIHEEAAGWVRPARVAGIALNTLALDAETACHAVVSAARDTGLPATDPVRFGARSLAQALSRRLAARRERATRS